MSAGLGGTVEGSGGYERGRDRPGERCRGGVRDGFIHSIRMREIIMAGGRVRVSLKISITVSISVRVY